nr:rhodoquinone biosynthesis methyltransferase RquA [Rhodoblastus acidophilus]
MSHLDHKRAEDVQVLLNGNGSTEIEPAAALRNDRPAAAPAQAPATSPTGVSEAAGRIPAYLTKHYWWAYVHPKAVWFFERQWLIDAILWGNYHQLRDAALDKLGPTLPGSTLQVASAYGDFTPALAERAAAGQGEVDVIDVLPIQLENLKQKLSADAPVRLATMDSAALNFSDARFDRAVLFFLLHEMPEEWRRRTLAETLRVVRPGGRVVIVEYARPARWNPMRYLFAPILSVLEPFALEVWMHDLREFMPAGAKIANFERRTFFGGLYQLVSFERQ